MMIQSFRNPCISGDREVRMTWRKNILALLVITIGGFLAGCARPTTSGFDLSSEEVDAEKFQQHLALFKKRTLQQKRVWRIAGVLNRAALDVCEEKIAHNFGVFVLPDIDSFEEDWREISRSAGHKANPVLGEVLANSGAEAGGLKSGDEILTIGEHVFEGPEGMTWNDYAEADPIEAGRHSIVLNRNNERITLFVSTQEYCDYPISIYDDGSLNAYADGEEMYITPRMVNFTADDQALAFVISHELAHNIMAHIDSKTVNAMGGLVVDLAILFATGVDTSGAFSNLGGQLYSKEFEAEADYIGLYLMAKAGMEIDGAEDFWRNLTVEVGSTNEFSQTHPSSPERFVAMEKTIEEIKGQIARGEKLQPRYKDN